MSMAGKITESSVEAFAIKLLKNLGYQYIYVPSIAPNCDTPEHASFEEVLLLDSLKKCSCAH